MIELLIAFILYTFNASAFWWGLYIALLVVDFGYAFYRGYYGI